MIRVEMCFPSITNINLFILSIVDEVLVYPSFKMFVQQESNLLYIHRLSLDCIDELVYKVEMII